MWVCQNASFTSRLQTSVGAYNKRKPKTSFSLNIVICEAWSWLWLTPGDGDHCIHLASSRCTYKLCRCQVFSSLRGPPPQLPTASVPSIDLDLHRFHNGLAAAGTQAWRVIPTLILRPSNHPPNVSKFISGEDWQGAPPLSCRLMLEGCGAWVGTE